MKKWEYNLDMTNADFENSPGQSGTLIQKGLEMSGEKGWELCGVIVKSGWILHYYKRPIETEEK